MVDLTGSATDVDNGHELTYSIDGDGVGTYGTAAIDGAGLLTYTLNNDAENVQALSEGQQETETFTIQVSDGEGGTDTTQVSINVIGTNDAPVFADTAPVLTEVTEDDIPEGSTLVVSMVDLTGSATDVDNGHELTYSIDGDGVGTYGTAAIDGAGLLTYTLNNDAENVQALSEGQQETETFTIQVSDGEGGTDTTQVSINVIGTNDAPVFADTAPVLTEVTEDGTLTTNVNLAGEIARGTVTAPAAIDIDGDDLTYSIVGSGAGTYGTAAIDGGVLTYTLDNTAQNVQALSAGQQETETFTIQVSDGEGSTDTTTVSVNVFGANDGPIATADTASVDENDSVVVNVLGNDSDLDNPNTDLSVQSVGTATNGTVSLVEGVVTYTPDADFNGVDSFTYVVSDSEGGTNQGTVNVTINEVEATAFTTSPDLVIGEATIDENGDFLLSNLTIDVLANDTGEGLEIEEFGYYYEYEEFGYYYEYYEYYLPRTNGDNGSLALDSTAQTLTFEPSYHFLGIDRFSYTASDDNNPASDAILVDMVFVSADALTLAVVEGSADPNYPSDSEVELFEATGPFGLSYTVGQGGVFSDASTSEGPSTIAGTYGTASVNSDGEWSYALFEDRSAAQAALALDNDGVIEEVFDLRITKTANGSFDDTKLTAKILNADEALEEAEALPDIALVDGVTTINVLDNDNGAGGLSINWIPGATDGILSVFAGMNIAGEASISEDMQSLIFTPEDGFSGAATFEYSMRDDFGNTDTGTVIINVPDDQSDRLPSGVVPPLLSLEVAPDGASPAGRIVIDADSSFPGSSIAISLDHYADGVLANNYTFIPNLVNYPDSEFPLASLIALPSDLEETNQFIVSVTHYSTIGSGVFNGETSYTTTGVGEISKAAVAQNVTGTAAADLILGSDLVDVIDGGGGADIIMGFDGDDSITFGGTSAAALNGGAGRDVLALTSGNIDLSNMNATSIEEIDLTNGVGQVLGITRDDLVALFDTGDIELNGLIDAWNAQNDPDITFDPTKTITILGADGDEIQLSADFGIQFVEVDAVVGNATGGEQLQIWQLVNTFSTSGEVLATLGIDSDVLVTDLYAGSS
jgi:VCBS repeat-containing protein